MNYPKTVMAILILAAGQMAASAQSLIVAPAVPDNLRVPAGHVAYFVGHATGTQNYICTPGDGAPAWKLFGPQATLFVTFPWLPGDPQQQIATHYLSANPEENGLSRPTWQHSLDSSAVWGKALASSTDKEYVAAGAIPWLLVQIVGARRGPMYGSALIPTTYIQRVNTAGGVAPAGGCDAQSLGAAVLVPYKTDYYFYQADKRR